MFKVGDKGKTRDGRDYEITSEENGYLVVTVENSPLWWYRHNGRGEGLADHWDLMTPESYKEVEMPEYLPEEVEATAAHECANEPSLFDELAELSARYAIMIEYDVASDVITFNRFA